MSLDDDDSTDLGMDGSLDLVDLTDMGMGGSFNTEETAELSGMGARLLLAAMGRFWSPDAAESNCIEEELSDTLRVSSQVVLSRSPSLPGLGIASKTKESFWLPLRGCLGISPSVLLRNEKEAGGFFLGV